MKNIAIITLMILSFETNAMDPAFSTNDTPFTKEMKSRLVWVPPNIDEPLPSFLKTIEDLANSNYTARISFRLFNAEGQEEQLIRTPDTNIIPRLGGLRASLFDFTRLVSEGSDLEYQFDEQKRQIIFKRKK